MVISALIGPRVGRTVDAIGGREVLALSNIVIGIGLIALALTQSQAMLWVAWLILGVGMGLGLYDTAFATLGRIYGSNARSAITGITLIAGFASTVDWPLTAWAVRRPGHLQKCTASPVLQSDGVLYMLLSQAGWADDDIPDFFKVLFGVCHEDVDTSLTTEAVRGSCVLMPFGSCPVDSESYE